MEEKPALIKKERELTKTHRGTMKYNVHTQPREMTAGAGQTGKVGEGRLLNARRLQNSDWAGQSQVGSSRDGARTVDEGGYRHREILQ